MPIPCRNLVAPPELARDAPGLDIAHPFIIGLLPVLRHENRIALFSGGDRGLGHLGGIHIPLLCEHWLDDHIGTVTKWLGNDLVFPPAVKAKLLNFLQHHFAGLEAVLALIAFRYIVLRRGDHPRLLVHQHDQRNVVAPRHLKVIEVMGASDFNSTCAEIRIWIFIRDDRDMAFGNRQAHQFADKILVAFVRRMHGYRAIAQHRFRARG